MFGTTGRRKDTPSPRFVRASKGFVPHRVFAITQRLRHRNRSFERDGQKRFSRQRRTWTACSQANLTKIRYRHQHPPEPPKTLEPWESLIAWQKRKWNTRLDELNRWQRTEFRVLEKMNGERFTKYLRYEVGSVWAYVIDVQVSRVAVNLPRGFPALPKRNWDRLSRRNNQTCLNRPQPAWDICAHANEIKASRTGHWKSCLNLFTRSNRLSHP